jgi:hypothetical protein
MLWKTPKSSSNCSASNLQDSTRKFQHEPLPSKPGTSAHDPHRLAHFEYRKRNHQPQTQTPSQNPCSNKSRPSSSRHHRLTHPDANSLLLRPSPSQPLLSLPLSPSLTAILPIPPPSSSCSTSSISVAPSSPSSSVQYGGGPGDPGAKLPCPSHAEPPTKLGGLAQQSSDGGDAIICARIPASTGGGGGGGTPMLLGLENGT